MIILVMTMKIMIMIIITASFRSCVNIIMKEIKIS